MNVEFVYLILIAINNYYDKRQTLSLASTTSMSKTIKICSDENRITVITLNEV
jgi:hypothetical protein